MVSSMLYGTETQSNTLRHFCNQLKHDFITCNTNKATITSFNEITRQAFVLRGAAGDFSSADRITRLG
jgi:hypothetical protein